LGCRLERERRRDPLRGDTFGKIGQIVKRPALSETNEFEGFRQAGDVIVWGGGETGASERVVEAAEETGRLGFNVPNLHEALLQRDRQSVAGRHPGKGGGAARHLEVLKRFT
jgi:hypothetical protein